MDKRNTVEHKLPPKENDGVHKKITSTNPIKFRWGEHDLDHEFVQIVKKRTDWLRMNPLVTKMGVSRPVLRRNKNGDSYMWKRDDHGKSKQVDLREKLNGE